jgi:hypothetical protein
MRKTLLAAAAALLFLLSAGTALAAPLGAFDPAGRDEYRYRWGGGFSAGSQDFFSSPLPDRSLWQNRAYLFGEYIGYDWSFALRGGATTFSSDGSTEWDPVPYVGGTGKVLVWAPPGNPWSVGFTVAFDQAFPFDTGGSRPSRISGLYTAVAGLGIQKQHTERQVVYGGPIYTLSGFKSSPRYKVPTDNALEPPVDPGADYYKNEGHVGLHGGSAWRLQGIDLQAEAQVTMEGASVELSFRLPLQGEPVSLVPRSLRELFGGLGERPREEKDDWFMSPERDDGPEEISGKGEEGKGR